MPCPWEFDCEPDAVWLHEQGFRPRRLVEPAWTEAEEDTLARALCDLASGDLSKPTENMMTGYFLSHHVMEGRHSEKSCCRKMYELGRRLGDDSGFSALLEREKGSDDEEQDGHGSGSDSDDEVGLPQPLCVRV